MGDTHCGFGACFKLTVEILFIGALAAIGKLIFSWEFELSVKNR